MKNNKVITLSKGLVAPNQKHTILISFELGASGDLLPDVTMIPSRPLSHFLILKLLAAVSNTCLLSLEQALAPGARETAGETTEQGG